MLSSQNGKLSGSPSCCTSKCLGATRVLLQLLKYKNKWERQAVNRSRTNGKPRCSVKYLANHFEREKGCRSSIYYKVWKRGTAACRGLSTCSKASLSIGTFPCFRAGEMIKCFLSQVSCTSVFSCSGVLRSVSQPGLGGCDDARLVAAVAPRAGRAGTAPPREREVMQISCQPCP